MDDKLGDMQVSGEGQYGVAVLECGFGNVSWLVSGFGLGGWGRVIWCEGCGLGVRCFCVGRGEQSVGAGKDRGL